MKQFRLILSLVLFLICAPGPSSAQTCPGVPVTYPYGVYNGILIIPGGAYYDDNSQPPQYHDANNNLIVTWSHAGSAYWAGTATPFGGDPQPLTVPITIAGQPVFTAAPQQLCNSQTGTFTVSAACGSTYYWSAPSGWSINGGGNTLTTSSMSVNITAGSSGNGIFYVNVSSDASNGATTASGWFGVPEFSGTHLYGSSDHGAGGSYQVCPSESLTFVPTGSYAYEILQHEWTLSGSYQYPGSLTTNTLIVTASASINETLYASYHARNSCGWSSTIYASANTMDCSGGGEDDFVYPNPSSEELRVSTSESTTEVSLYNSSRELVFKMQPKSSEKELKVPVHALPNGIYYLTINKGGKVSTRRVKIEH